MNEKEKVKFPIIAIVVLFGFLVGFTTLCVTYSILRRKGVIDASNNKC